MSKSVIQYTEPWDEECVAHLKFRGIQMIIGKWYFTGETEDVEGGPYDTAEQAEEAMIKYAWEL